MTNLRRLAVIRLLNHIYFEKHGFLVGKDPLSRQKSSSI
jgi:hypothetical protein